MRTALLVGLGLILGAGGLAWFFVYGLDQLFDAAVSVGG